MSLFLENPLPILAVGVVLAGFSLLLVVARGNLASIGILLAVVAATFLLLLAEKRIVTDRELIEESLSQLTIKLEANDLEALRALIDPAAKDVRNDAAELLPRIKVKDAAATAVLVTVDASTNPPHATASFRGRIDGVHTQSGARVFYFDQVEIDWKKEGDRWLVSDYRVYLRGRPIDAVKSARGNRPVP